ncbi:MAG: DUF167 domain-containing protein [Desulfatiglandaceae bacterium]
MTAEQSMAQSQETIINVKVLPRSSKNEVVGKDQNRYKIKLTAPALEGKANKALVQLMAKKLGLAKKDVRIVSGERSKHKSICIEGPSAKDVEHLLLSG